QADARKKAARAEFDQWLSTAGADEVAAQVPSDGLQLHAALREGTGKTVNVTVHGEAREVPLPAGTWDKGHVAAQALRTQPGGGLPVEDAGDFGRDQAFAVGAWVRIPRRGTTGAVVARMDDRNGNRGWDLWIEGDRVGAHLIHKFPEDAIKVLGQTQLQPNQWY